MRYNSSYSRERVKDNVINRNFFSIQNELTAVSRAINTWPYYDITGAVPGEGKSAVPFIQTAIDAAYAAGGGVVLIPSGLWLLTDPFYDSVYDLYYFLTPKDNVFVVGLDGAILKVGPGISSSTTSTWFSIFASKTPVSNFGIRALEFNLNAANNEVALSSGKQHNVLTFYGNNGRGNDIEVTFCNIHDSAGSNPIMSFNASGSQSYVLGKNWLIAHNTFKNIALDAWDNSTIWAWARNVRILNNDFIQDPPDPWVPPSYTQIKYAAEMHGSGGVFRGNYVSYYTALVWIAPNLTESVNNVHVDHNIGGDILKGLATFWRYDPPVGVLGEKEIHDIYIEDNVVDLVDGAQGPTNAYPAVGIQIYHQLSVTDIYVRRNTLRKADGNTYLFYGARILPTKSGEEFTRIFFEENTFWGTTIGALLETYDDGGVDLGSLGTISFVRNKFYNPRPNATYYTYPYGIRGLIHDSLPIDVLTINDNEFADFETASNTDIGISLIGPITTLRRSGNRFYNIDSVEIQDVITGSNFFGEQAYYQDLDFDNNEVLTTGIINSFFGEIMVKCASATAYYRVDGSGALTAISANATFSTTKDNSNTINCYFDTDNYFKVQNKSGLDNLTVKVRKEEI